MKYEMVFGIFACSFAIGKHPWSSKQTPKGSAGKSSVRQGGSIPLEKSLAWLWKDCEERRVLQNSVGEGRSCQHLLEVEQRVSTGRQEAVAARHRPGSNNF